MTKLTIHLTVAAAAGAPRVPLEITPDISSAELRKQASEVTKIPPTALKLIFRGRMIANDESTEAVTEYKLEDGSVLHCMGKPVENAAPAPSAAAPSSNAAPATGAAALPSVNLIPPAAAAAATSMTGGNSSGDPLAQALQTMRASNPPQVYKTAVETLEKLLAKIIENPLEEKYRRVKKENPAFVRKLGGLTGGAAAVKATGFVEQMDESGQPVYQMVASADAWPKLLTAQTTVKNAAQAAEASVAAPSLPTGMPGFPPANPGMAGMPGMPDMSQAAASLMQNPQALEGMLQNPMVQNMMRNDPRFANNPMARQMMESLFQNPAAMQQSLQMMQDPNFQQQMQQMQQNPDMMQQMAQQMQQMQGMFGAGGMSGGGSTGGGAAPAAPSMPSQPTQQQQGNQGNDSDVTEEEMIAEAIRRSLQDNNNNNNN